MSNKCNLRLSHHHFESLWGHLFPGDDDEHGAVVLAGLSIVDGHPLLTVREVHYAEEGRDYTEGTIGYRALNPQFIHRLITRARDERLVYLAVHNHFSDMSVGFSGIDLDSHERGYPALLQIVKGMPVGGMVCGKRSMQVDLWLPTGDRLTLETAAVVGTTIRHLYPKPRRTRGDISDNYNRQIKMFGKIGQDKLRNCRVGVIGLGGVGSLVAEYLARVGVGNFFLVDDDHIEESNLSRIVGATMEDARHKASKVAVAHRLILQANEGAKVQLLNEDVAKESVAKQLTGCDYLFLAADSMRARLVFNSLVQQYIIPGAQLGSKIRSNDVGLLLDVMSANRPVRPGIGCLWCNELIDPTQLAKEAKTDEERRNQAYGVEEPNPSVITLNAVSAAHAVNDFLLDYLNLRGERDLYYEHFHFLNGKRMLVEPRRDSECSECSDTGLRYGRGDSMGLPCIQG